MSLWLKCRSYIVARLLYLTIMCALCSKGDRDEKDKDLVYVREIAQDDKRRMCPRLLVGGVKERNEGGRGEGSGNQTSTYSCPSQFIL